MATAAIPRSPHSFPGAPPKSPAGSPDPAEFASFVEPFVVDFQNSLPVADDTKLADLPEWDSLAAPGTIVMRDTGYGVTITGNDLKECATVGDTSGSIRFLETGTTGSLVDGAAGCLGDAPIVQVGGRLDEATFIESTSRASSGARCAARPTGERRSRMSITTYHCADDPFDPWRLIDALASGYEFRLRHHSSYYHDKIFHAAPA